VGLNAAGGGGRGRQSLAEAAALYGGDLLSGLAVSGPPFEAWPSAERERLRELALETNGPRITVDPKKRYLAGRPSLK
jgi:hypothetical protein